MTEPKTSFTPEQKARRATYMREWQARRRAAGIGRPRSGREKEQARLRARRYYEANRERLQAERRASYQSNKSRVNAQTKAWREAHPEQAARYSWFYKLRKYGITPEQFDAMLIAQSGRCAICSDPMDPPNIDHCHTAGHVRGLLCGPCNRGLGMFRDSPAALRAAADYLGEVVYG